MTVFCFSAVASSIVGEKAGRHAVKHAAGGPVSSAGAQGGVCKARAGSEMAGGSAASGAILRGQ